MERRGACPTLREPMLTGDGLLVRLSPAGTGWSPSDLAALAQAAARFGSGILEVTSRGNLQIRGLTPANAAALADHVEELAIPLRTGLAIDTGPLAGIDAGEIIDPLPLARELHTMVEAAGLTARLAPKMSVVIDGGGALGMGDIIADVRLTADAASRGWLIAIGGTAHTARPLGVVAASEAVGATMALLEAIAAKGKFARGRDLTDDELANLRGFPPLRRRFAAPPLPPSRGERIGDGQRPHPHPLQGGEVARRSRDGVGVDAAPRDAVFPVGRFPLRDASLATAFALPFGQIDAATLSAFCTDIKEADALEIHLAPGRGLIVPGLEAATCTDLEAKAAALGFITDATDPRLAIAACAGAPFCASAHIATRTLGAEIAAQAPELLAGRTLHVSGCDKRCAEPPAPDFTILGTADGCLVLPGDGRNAPSGPAVAAGEALAALRRLADTERAHEHETARDPQPAES
ncbi:MAG: precorrin-3B synthase [Mesorhizobium sp.]|nr:precorrin-3B synthase [Mesorhizobium sp.]